MGIITFAFGMGGPLANFAGLLHMTMHSLTKSAIFFSVGHIAQIKGTQKMADIRGLTVSHPVLGWGLVLGVIAIVGLPPMGIFMSEFLIVTSTFARAAGARRGAGLRAAGGLGALLLRLNGLAFGEPHGERRAVAGFVRADVRASGAGAGGRDLSSAGAGRLVPARRELCLADRHGERYAETHRARARSRRASALAARASWAASAWQQAIDLLAVRPMDAARAVGRARARAHGADRRRATSAASSARVRRATLPVGRPARMRRRSGWSAPCATSSGLEPEGLARHARLARPRQVAVRKPLGLRTQAAAADPSPIAFLPARRREPAPDPGGPGARRASSSPAISASRRAARRSCGSRSGSGTCTRGSSR